MMFLSNCSDYHELEARFIQLESKYLVLLREYQEPHIGNDHIASFIESIITFEVPTTVLWGRRKSLPAVWCHWLTVAVIYF